MQSLKTNYKGFLRELCCNAVSDSMHHFVHLSASPFEKLNSGGRKVVVLAKAQAI